VSGSGTTTPLQGSSGAKKESRITKSRLNRNSGSGSKVESEKSEVSEKMQADSSADDSQEDSDNRILATG